MVSGIRVVDIYLPNGNPIGTPKFDYKLVWMERLIAKMSEWKNDGVPTVIGGDFNVIPEDIDCHKPASWIHEALFQPEPRALYRAMLTLGYTDVYRSLHPAAAGQFTFWDYFRQAFENNRGIRIDHFLVSPSLQSRIAGCEIDKGPRVQPRPSDHTPKVFFGAIALVIGCRDLSYFVNWHLRKKRRSGSGLDLKVAQTYPYQSAELVRI